MNGAVFAEESMPAQPATAAMFGPGGSALDKTRIAEEIQRLTDTIALVQKDRDSGASKTDVADVDSLLTEATSLRDAAQATLRSDDVSAVPNQLGMANAAVMAARDLLRANLSSSALPSDQAPASRALVSAYYTVDGVISTPASDSPTDLDKDSAFFLDTAKSLYAKAYRAYQSGDYGQAQGIAFVASTLASASLMSRGDLAIFTIDDQSSAPASGTSEGATPESGASTQSSDASAGSPPSDATTTVDGGDPAEHDNGQVIVVRGRGGPGDEGGMPIVIDGGSNAGAGMPGGRFTIHEGPNAGPLESGGPAVEHGGGDVLDPYATPLEVPAPDWD